MKLRPPKRFCAPKGGNSRDEYEDASMLAYPYRLLGPDGGGVARAAVADGASQSVFARSWAKILVDAFAKEPLGLAQLSGPSLARWLEPRQREWNEAVPWERLPWHGEAKARDGAMAALLGVTFRAARRSILWEAVAVGDCCLFIVHDDALVASFPIGDAAQFNDTPSMICSNPDNNRGLWARVHQLGGECRPGDRFILASDALACWILARHKEGQKPWPALLDLDARQWPGWLQARRAERSIRNDDVTLLTIEAE